MEEPGLLEYTEQMETTMKPVPANKVEELHCHWMCNVAFPIANSAKKMNTDSHLDAQQMAQTLAKHVRLERCRVFADKGFVNFQLEDEREVSSVEMLSEVKVDPVQEEPNSKFKLRVQIFVVGLFTS